MGQELSKPFHAHGPSALVAVSARLTLLFCWVPRHVLLGLDNWHRVNIKSHPVVFCKWPFGGGSCSGKVTIVRGAINPGGPPPHSVACLILLTFKPNRDLFFIQTKSSLVNSVGLSPRLCSALNRHDVNLTTTLLKRSKRALHLEK